MRASYVVGIFYRVGKQPWLLDQGHNYNSSFRMHTIPIGLQSKRASFAPHHSPGNVGLQHVVISSLEAWSWRVKFVAVAHNSLSGGEQITFRWENVFFVPWSTVKMFPKAKADSHHRLLAHSLIQMAPAVCHKGQSSFLICMFLI